MAGEAECRSERRAVGEDCRNCRIGGQAGDGNRTREGNRGESTEMRTTDWKRKYKYEMEL
jgi:hypothetical protein